MEIILWSILSLFFLYINYRVIKNDLKEKRIPNKYLVYLLYILPFWYLYVGYYWYLNEIHLGFIILQVLLTFFISFLLYHFNIWWAGDTKYLLVLSLFIPHIGIIPFIWNIAIIVLFYLLLYSIWFCLGKNLWVKHKRQTLYSILWKIKKDEFSKNRQYTKRKKNILRILKVVNIFFIFFICIRLLRIHVIESLITSYNLKIYKILSSDYIFYIIFLWIAVALTLLLIIKYITLQIKKIFWKDSPIIFIVTLNIWAFIIILWEYLRDPWDFFINLWKILTLYLMIYICVKILFWIYRIIFVTSEENFVHIDNLKEGMIINKSYLLEMLNNLAPYNKDIYTNYPFIDQIKREVNSHLHTDDVKNLQKIIKSTNKSFKKHTKSKNDFSQIIYIKTVQSFSFSIYIISWFFTVFLIDLPWIFLWIFL